jgi:predicted P-loop ATPase
MKKNNLSLIKGYLSKHFVFQYNIVTDRTEFRKRDSKEGFQSLSEYFLNSLFLQLTKMNISCTKELLRTIVESDFVQKYNPFQEYMYSLPKWNGIDYIGHLAKTIKTEDDSYFDYVFRKWIVALVGSLMDDKVINHTTLIFTGEQGIGKTTWFRRLVPQELSEYYFEGSITPNNKDDEIQMGENMLINIDELQSLNSKNMEALKSLITLGEIKVRRPYARRPEIIPRRASFAGSGNTKEFLTDTTGNRRFICIAVKYIDNQHNVLLDNVYSQALYLYNNGFQYWFSQDEIRSLNQHNEGFTEISIEEDLIDRFLKPCRKEEESVQFGSATEIMTLLIKKSNLDLDSDAIQNRNPSKYGKILNKKSFEKGKTKDVRGYYYKLIDNNIV